MTEITVYECVDCQEEFEYADYTEKQSPRCPLCNQILRYVGTYTEEQEELD